MNTIFKTLLQRTWHRNNFNHILKKVGLREGRDGS
jgi:hypothetical protein